MENTELDINVDATDEWEYLPFAKEWKETFEQIQTVLSDSVTANQKERILTYVAKIVHTLVTKGDTYEDIVLQTAQIYVFAKETGFDISPLESYYPSYIIKGARALLSNDLKSIFENQELLYLGKIKIADYLVQLSEEHAKTNRTLISEVKKVIKTYGEKTHKKLVKLLIKEVGV